MCLFQFKCVLKLKFYKVSFHINVYFRITWHKRAAVIINFGVNFCVGLVHLSGNKENKYIFVFLLLNLPRHSVEWSDNVGKKPSKLLLQLCETRNLTMKCISQAVPFLCLRMRLH